MLHRIIIEFGNFIHFIKSASQSILHFSFREFFFKVMFTYVIMVEIWSTNDVLLMDFCSFLLGTIANLGKDRLKEDFHCFE